MNANDLCAAPLLGQLVQAGVTSLKIEGRAKTFYYAASTAAAYRRALDVCLRNPQQYVCPPEVLCELEKTSHRTYSTGFLQGGPAADGEAPP